MQWITQKVFRTKLYENPREAIKDIAAQAFEWGEENQINVEFHEHFELNRRDYQNILVVHANTRKYHYKVHSHSEGTLSIRYGLHRSPCKPDANIPDYMFKHRWRGN